MSEYGKKYYQENKDKWKTIYMEKKLKWKENNKDYWKHYDKKRLNQPKRLYSNYKGQAKWRGINFNLTFDEFMKLWNKPCVYCGNEIETVGIDRVNSGIGYEINNVVPCCWKCNSMKNDSSVDDFVAHCKKVAKRHEFNEES